MSMEHIKIRDAQGTDLNCILDTFMESFFNDSQLANSCRVSIFKKNFRKVIDHILSRSTIQIACFPEDPNTILGYIVYEPGIVHYTFVKMAFRRFGIATQLLNHAFPKDGSVIQFPLKTKMLKVVLQDTSRFDYNPFILFHKEIVNV